MKQVKLPLALYHLFTYMFSDYGSHAQPWKILEYFNGYVVFEYDAQGSYNISVDETLQRVYREFHDSDWRGWV